MTLPLWAKALIFAAILGAAAWAVNAWGNKHEQIGYDRAVAKSNAERIVSLQESAIETAAMLGAKENAINVRIEAEKKAKSALAAARAESGELRDTIADLRSSLSDASLEACRARADAGLRLLGACQERYLGVAEAAKGHLADALMCQQAWPRTK